MASSNILTLPRDEQRNPRFLGAGYQAGCRVYDQRERGLDFSGGGTDISDSGDGQRWTMLIRLKDYDGVLKQRLLSHQETRQQNQRFFMAVPQDPWVSPMVAYPNLNILVAEDAEAGSTMLKLKAKNTGERFNLYPRWFFRMFTPVDHYKVYNLSLIHI